MHFVVIHSFLHSFTHLQYLLYAGQGCSGSAVSIQYRLYGRWEETGEPTGIPLRCRGTWQTPRLVIGIVLWMHKKLSSTWPCLFLFAGETYSDKYSHTDTCHPCTECTGLMRMETPCTDSNDALCVCDYGYYMNKGKGGCEPCTVCSRGYGVYMRCEPDHDTVCELCEDETYSDQESSLDPCLPCTICDDGSDELETLRECSSVADAVCYGERLLLNFPDYKDTFTMRCLAC